MSDDNTTNIDPNLIADLVTSRLIQASGAASAAAQPDVVAATIKELRDGNFHDDFIDGISKAIARMNVETDRKINAAVNNTRAQGNDQRAVDIVQGVIAEYAEADPLIGYSDVAIYNKIVEKFKSDPSLATARATFGTGKVDRAFWTKLAKDEVNLFYKMSGKDAPTRGTATKPATAALPTAQITPGSTNNATNAAGLTEFGQERYENFKALAIKSGKSPEEAHTLALKSASRFK